MFDFLPVILAALGGLSVLGFHAFQRPRGVYLRSVGCFLAVTLGWALFWLMMSPANEAGFGFFAIWVVLAALALLAAIAACSGATLRYLVDSLRARGA